MLRETTKIDKWSIVTKIEYMDWEIFKGSRFYSYSKLDIKLHQKKENKILYLPEHSGHTRLSINNYVVGELKRYVRSNTKEIIFWGIKINCYERVLDRGFKKWK